MLQELPRARNVFNEQSREIVSVNNVFGDFLLNKDSILILNQPHFYYYLQSTENPISSILFTKLSLNPSSLLASTTTIRFFLAREHPT